MSVAPMFKTVLLLGLISLRGVYSEDAPTCKQAGCEKADVSSLLQSRIHASLEGTDELECTFVAMMEEDTNIGEPDSPDDGYMWGECEDGSGTTHYLFDDDQLENFVPGDKLKLTVSEVSGVDAPTAPNLPWQADNVPLYRIVSVISHDSALLTEQDNSLTEGATAAKEVDVIMMICNYKDQNAFVTDEERVMNSFYQKLGEKLYSTDGRGSFADMLEASSYGRFTAPRSKGKVVTVTINKNFPTAGCPYNDMARDCKQATKDQTQVNPDDFTYREFFIPTSGSGCRWGGLANVGCGHYSLVPRKAACHAWYRSDRPFVRAHEIGHNLGFLHAGGDSGGGQFVEYGDPQASMGASYVFSSFNAANRYQGGFLHKVAGEAVEFQPDFNAGNSGTFKLQSLSKPLGEPGADAVAVFWTCPKCVPKVSSHSSNVGGYLWLQFRGDEGYSASKLSSKYQNKVYVHLARKYTSKFYGKGTEMWQMMEKGASYTAPNSETTVTVNDIVGDLATVTISVQGTSTGYFLADGGTSCDQACQKKGGAWMCDANSLKDAAASVATCKSIIESLGKTPQRGGQYRDDNAGCTYHPGQTGWYQVMRRDGDPGCSVINRDRSRQRVCSCSKNAPTTSPCIDKYSQCPGWANYYCTGRWASWMATNCPKSCSKCS